MHAIGAGEIAALITSVSWAGSCQIHTMASRILGGVNVTTARVPLYVGGLFIAVLISGAQASMPAGALFFILLSAITGISVCDPLLYSSAVIVGPRIASLVQSLSACLTAIFGMLFLGESLSLTGWLGILSASSGVAFVLMEGGLKSGTDLSGLTRAQIFHGVGRAFLSALTLAFSFLALKQALRLGMDPVWASFVRMACGGAMLWCLMLLRGKLAGILREAWTSWQVMRLLLIGCAVSTIGNCLAPVAMKFTEAGVAATLIGLQPIMIIIIGTLVERRFPTVRAAIGTTMAFCGTAMIFLR